MSAAHSIDIVLQLTAQAAGVAPIDGGRISFTTGISGNLPQTAKTFCKNITYSDLVEDSGNSEYIIFNSSGMLVALNSESEEVPVRNLVGDPVANFSTAGFFYLQTNVGANIEGVFAPLPPTVSANGSIMINSAIVGSVAAPGAEVLRISWAAADINSLGASNFRATLIFAVT